LDSATAGTLMMVMLVGVSYGILHLQKIQVIDADLMHAPLQNCAANDFRTSLFILSIINGNHVQEIRELPWTT
jgi:hypothetical protein